jgi:hypothetical protein
MRIFMPSSWPSHGGIEGRPGSKCQEGDILTLTRRGFAELASCAICGVAGGRRERRLRRGHSAAAIKWWDEAQSTVAG